MLPVGLNGFICDFLVVGKFFFFLSWVGTNGNINYLRSFSLASSHMAISRLHLVILGKPVLPCVLPRLRSYCGTFLRSAVSAGGCLTVTAG